MNLPSVVVLALGKSHALSVPFLQPYRLTEDEKAELRRKNIEMSQRERLVVVRCAAGAERQSEQTTRRAMRSRA